MNNFPSFRKSLPNQRKHATRLIFFALQMISPKNQRGIRPQKPKLEFRKIQLPHRGLIGIAFLVARQHAIPTACHAAAPGKRQFRRSPISLKKCIHIASIPSGLLLAKNPADRFTISLSLLGRLGNRPHLHK